MTTTVKRGLMAVRAEGATPNVAAAVADLNQAFAAFKAEHTKQLDELKSGIQSSDTTAKVEKVAADVERLQKEVEDAHVKLSAGNVSVGGKDTEYTQAFQAHMRKGEVQASLNKGTNADGGYLAPVEWDRTITDKLVKISPMRELATVQTISTAGYTKLFNLGGTTSGWVGETAARPQTNTATFAPLTYTTGEIYANPTATQQILDDAAINLEQWLAGEVQTEFALQEGKAFWGGDGVNKPTGILTYVTGGTNAAKHPFGAIAQVNSGAAAAITADSIISLIYSLPSEFRANARFVMNNATQAAVRKLKDGQGNYLWQPSFVAGQPATLAGYPITEVADMPDVAANANAILFGDFKRGYIVIDRTGVRVMRDPYTNKPYVHFYTTKRVGGGLLNPEPLRALKIAA